MKKAFSIVLSTLLFLVVPVAVSAESAEENVYEIGHYTIQINDPTITAEDLDAILEKVLAGPDEAAVCSTAHTCSPTGPYQMKPGAWNYVYDANGKLFCKFRLWRCAQYPACKAEWPNEYVYC